MIFGPKTYYRPVCVYGEHGFYGGPAGYVRTTDPGGGPIVIDLKRQARTESIIAAWRRSEITLAELEDELDSEENQ